MHGENPKLRAALWFTVTREQTFICQLLSLPPGYHKTKLQDCKVINLIINNRPDLENSSLLGYDAILLGKYVHQTFKKINVSSSSES